MRIGNSQISYQQQSEFRSQRQLQEQQNLQQQRRFLDFNQRQIGVSVDAEHSLSLTYENQQLNRLSSSSEIRDGEQLTKIAYEQLVNEVSQGQLDRNISVNNIIINGRDAQLNQSRISNLKLDGALNGTDVQSASGSTGFASSGQWGNEARVSVTQRGEYQEQSYHKLVSEGQIQLEDGRQIDFRLELELGRDYKESGEINTELKVEALIDPLVINFGGSADLLGSASFEFDIDSDGEVDQIQQLQQGVGFLALDLNQDGEINNGQELFGTQSGNGFADLAQYDSDNNGWIDENDEIFSQLSIYQPQAGEGQPQQLSLLEAGVGAIYLGTQATEIDLKSETNELQAQIRQQGVFLKESGEVGLAAQIDFAKQGTTPAAAGEASLNDEFNAFATTLETERGPRANLGGIDIDIGQIGEPVLLVSGASPLDPDAQFALIDTQFLAGQGANLDSVSRFGTATRAAEPIADELGLEGEFLLARFFAEQAEQAKLELESELEQGFSRTELAVTQTSVAEESVDEQIKQQAANLLAESQAFVPQNDYQSSYREDLNLAAPKKTEQIIENILKPMLAQQLQKRDENIQAYREQAQSLYQQE